MLIVVMCSNVVRLSHDLHTCHILDNVIYVYTLF